MPAINDVVDLSVESGVAVITVHSKPVNALSQPVRAGLLDAIRQADADPSARAIALLCEGQTYFAGFDIAEFDTGFLGPGLDRVIAALEGCTKPVVTGIHGTALGGGLETALGCHYRVAVASAKLGLPEVLLGLLPGAGGTQRLPRIVGARQALDMITSGRPVGGDQALAMGLVDRLSDPASLRATTIAFAHEAAGKATRPRIRDREDMIAKDRQDPGLFDAFRTANAARFRGLNAPAAIIAAVEAAVRLPFDEGLAEESRLFMQLYADEQSAALRYGFFADREAAKIPRLSRDVATLPIRKVGVVGAGTMGGGIAMNFLGAGIPVTLVEIRQEALDRGVAVIRRNYEATAAKGRLTQADVERCMGLLTPSLSMQDLADCDLVIEAVFENLALKQSVFRQLDGIVKDGAILASNTSFLDLDAIAAATNRPEAVIGLHFFSPANVMRMLEVVRGRQTGDAVLATAMKLARQIGKVAVVTGVCHGFIANRIFDKRQKQADLLLLEGAMPWDVDRVAVAYGFPMGPFAMLDLVGLDVIGWNPDETASRSVIEILNEAGRHGQKSGKGYYDYDERRRSSPSTFSAQAIEQFAARAGIARRTIDDGEIAERMLYPMIREAALILEEGIAYRASDIDVAVKYGYGWPAYRGGPMFEADRIGAAELVRRLDGLAGRHGDGFEPTGLMRRLAESGGRFRDVAPAGPAF